MNRERLSAPRCQRCQYGDELRLVPVRPLNPAAPDIGALAVCARRHSSSSRVRYAEAA
jgi:hypothetical protein